ncbi:hypothetical protein, partial [Peribacillus muralis]|uniref:hypothetical protein n=1 Tax=Peribacillus muralis TaxID=264697 RepID=UPI00366F4096
HCRHSLSAGGRGASSAEPAGSPHNRISRRSVAAFRSIPLCVKTRWNPDCPKYWRSCTSIVSLHCRRSFSRGGP